MARMIKTRNRSGVAVCNDRIYVFGGYHDPPNFLRSVSFVSV